MQDTITMEGRVTIDNSNEVRERLAAALRLQPSQLDVDLSRVTYIDLSGLATLLEATRIARGQNGRLLLNGIQGQVAYLLEATHLAELFDIVPEQQSA
jgi:anti-sigma B factor antagonist